MTADPIRVLIVDDHEIVRKGISALLSTEPGIQVLGEASDGKSALVKTETLHPDVILMDLVMPGMDGIQATTEISQRWPDARILILTSFAANEQVFPAIKAGALGYLLKDSSPEELVQAIQQVYRGESWLHPAIARKVLQELAKPAESPASSKTAMLTEREIEVLRFLAQGHSNREIADHLFVSEATIRTHVSNILSKLHLASRTQAALFALKQGLATLDESHLSEDE
jgi:NarL family two-component system response regulator LiaR